MSTPSDSEMLDWLERQGSGYEWKVQTPKDYPFIQRCVFVSRNSSYGFKTVREAIAAAMQEKENP